MSGTQDGVLENLAWMMGGLALTMGMGIVACQSDYVSRKYLLTPERLSHKRLREYNYHWEMELTACLSKIRQFELNKGLLLDAKYNVFETLLTDTGLDDFIAHDLLGKQSSKVTILGMSKDERQASQDWFLYLLLDNGSRRVQVPLVPFGMRLADAMEQQVLSSTTFCFVADASSGQSSKLLLPILADAMGMTVWQEPVWMAMMAYIAQQRVFTEKKLDRTLAALLRLLALPHKKIPYQTIVVFLPGQATTATLLSSLVRSFPSDRHVFCYSTLMDSLSYSLTNNITTSTASKADHHHTVMPSCVSATTPLDVTNSLLRKIRHLDKQLANLPFQQASTIQAWISSVDAFLSLKENDNKYVPFVSRLPYLDPNNNITIDKDTNQPAYALALSNLLHYITGTRSRPLPEDLLETCVETLKSVFPSSNTTTTTTIISPELKKLVEACAFCHKGILIENKTLLDTVQPRKHWTLIAAKKLKACACCLEPGADEEDDEDEGSDDGSPKETKKSVNSIPPRRNYVDGKAAFAFDPTAFTGLS